jgi:hypothetical protein
MGYTIELRIFPLRHYTRSASSVLSQLTTYAVDAEYCYEWENDNKDIVYAYYYELLEDAMNFTHKITSICKNMIVDCMYQDMPFRLLYSTNKKEKAMEIYLLTENEKKMVQLVGGKKRIPIPIPILSVSKQFISRKGNYKYDKICAHCSIFKEELISYVMHPRRISRLLNQYGWEALDDF